MRKHLGRELLKISTPGASASVIALGFSTLILTSDPGDHAGTHRSTNMEASFVARDSSVKNDDPSIASICILGVSHTHTINFLWQMLTSMTVCWRTLWYPNPSCRISLKGSIHIF